MEIKQYQREIVPECIRIWEQDGVIAHATDTCFGLAADITNEQAVAKIPLIKNRPLDKPMSILVSDVEMLKQYGQVNERAQSLIDAHLPGALTLVLPKTDLVPAHYFPETSFIGLRIPDIPWFLELIREFGKPVTTTSANLSGQKEVYSAKAVYEMFEHVEQKPDLVLDTACGNGKPSTVVKIDGDQIEVLRQGDLHLT